MIPPPPYSLYSLVGHTWGSSFPHDAIASPWSYLLMICPIPPLTKLSQYSLSLFTPSHFLKVKANNKLQDEK